MYGTRGTGVRCTNTFGDAVQCQESGSRLEPVGTRSVNSIERYVDVTISLARSALYGTENPLVRPDGTKVAWDMIGIAADDFTVAFAAGECANAAAAAAAVATLLAADPMADRPREIKIQAEADDLSCDSR